MNVSSGGHSDEEMSKSLSHGDSDSDAETDGQGESDCYSGPIKLPNLSAFASQPVIEERTLALGKLMKITRFPELLKDLGLITSNLQV